MTYVIYFVFVSILANKDKIDNVQVLLLHDCLEVLERNVRFSV